MIGEEAFRSARLLVVGNINRDVKVTGVRPGPHLLADGETPAASIGETIGGGGANSACAAAALGARTAFFGKVGADPLGERLEAALRRAGVETHLARDPRRPTGTSVALGYEDGCRHFVSCLPASEALALEDIDLSAVKGPGHLLRADVWFPPAMLLAGRGGVPPGNEGLFRHAREAGLSVSIDLNWDPLWGRAPAAEVEARKASVRALLPHADLVHGNVRELCEFTGAADLDGALARLASGGARAVAVHLGSGGAGYYRDGSLEVEPAAPAARLVNTTGTGDVLSVCLMLLHHREDVPPREKLRLANRIVAEFIEGRRTLIPAL